MTGHPFISSLRIWPIYVPAPTPVAYWAGKFEPRTSNDAERFTLVTSLDAQENQP